MVPLSNAWRSGARNWTTDRRRIFANDLQRPQLIAVDDGPFLSPALRSFVRN